MVKQAVRRRHPPAGARDLVRESWERALEQESLKPIADPHIHDLKWEDGAPLTFELHVEVKPDLTLYRLGGFRSGRTGRRP